MKVKKPFLAKNTGKPGFRCRTGNFMALITNTTADR